MVMIGDETMLLMLVKDLFYVCVVYISWDGWAMMLFLLVFMEEQ